MLGSSQSPKFHYPGCSVTGASDSMKMLVWVMRPFLLTTISTLFITLSDWRHWNVSNLHTHSCERSEEPVTCRDRLRRRREIVRLAGNDSTLFITLSDWRHWNVSNLHTHSCEPSAELVTCRVSLRRRIEIVRFAGNYSFPIITSSLLIARSVVLMCDCFQMTDARDRLRQWKVDAVPS
jgi:hypothetical protein